MEKILLKLHVPAIGQIFELFVPDTMNGENIIRLVSDILFHEYQIKRSTQDCDLFLKPSGKAIPLDCNLYDLSIHDGDELFLM